MSEWHTIDSAPKDGALILIYDGEIHTASWGFRSSMHKEKEWLSNGCVDDWMTFENPTHWMPLPQPPKVTK